MTDAPPAEVRSESEAEAALWARYEELAKVGQYMLVARHDWGDQIMDIVVAVYDVSALGDVVMGTAEGRKLFCTHPWCGIRRTTVSAWLVSELKKLRD